MKIGDKVRFIHTKGEGIIKKIIDEKTLEVEIEDGFIVPVLKNEIVVVAKEEISRFKVNDAEAESKIPALKDKNQGIFLACAPFNDRIYSFNIINNSQHTILFSMGEKTEHSHEGVASGVLRPNSFEKIKDLKIAEFESWPEFTIQVLFHKQGRSEQIPPLDKKVKFKAASFFKSKKFNAILDKEVFLYQLDFSGHILKPEEIKTFFSGEQSSEPAYELSQPNYEVDLHIEKINSGFKSLPSSEILKFQLTYFEKQLENAIATGMKDIIFIHGTGNGTLKNSIHKKLSENIFIKYYEDARKEKFGYGATLVKIK